MRNLILFRGAPGSGKSHAIEAMGLKNNQLSMDAIRRVVGGVDLSPTGEWTISQEQNKRVADQFVALAQERMARGETLAIEAVFAELGWMREFVQMARKHRYNVCVVDFSTMPPELIRAQNAQRDDVVRLDDKSMTRWIEALKNQGPTPDDLADRVIFWQADGSHIANAREFLAVPSLDISGYKKAMFIGDLQGCLTPLVGPGGLLENGFEDDTFYLFMGDLVDRGPQNGPVIRWFLDHALPRHGQVRWLWGNHEDHLQRWALGQEPVSPEFSKRTLPQLIEAGITPDDAGALCDKADAILLLRWNGKNILATHAGLPCLPDKLELVSMHQLTHGTGSWSDPVDTQFTRQAPADWIQVHGHRNHGRQPIIATPQSINLEDRVEYGGALRAATLDEHGWTAIEIPNEHVVALRDRLPRKKPDWAPAWMQDPANTVLTHDLMAAMRAHEGVNESISSSMPDIASYNFTRDVFYKKSWDELSVKARGLFFHRTTGTVVARGYDKFFNIGERAETQMSALENSLVFPVHGYVKENGYLGNLGLHPVTNQLVYASKSTPDSDFADWFKQIMHDTTTADQRERIRRFLRDYECSMVFEVIDPVRDPHMVEYEKPGVVLLDVFHRSISGRKLPYDDLTRVAGDLGLTAKKRAMVFRDFAQMKGFLDSKDGDLSWQFKQSDIEGFVFEDKTGFQFKDKAAPYSFWKSMRSTKDRLVKLRVQREDVLQRVSEKRQVQALSDLDQKMAQLEKRNSHPLARHFIQWMQTQPVEALDRDIISLRKSYIEQAKPEPALWKEKWDPFGQPAPQARTLSP